jgi:hypothetical protein
VPAIAALDPALAAALLAVGRPAWQALAGALSAADPRATDHRATNHRATNHKPTDYQAVGHWGSDSPAASLRPTDHSGAGRPQTDVLYSDAPLGVAYLVATLIP